MNTETETLAAAIESAKLELAEAEARHQAAVDHVETLRTRIAGIETRRSEITSLRADGNTDQDLVAEYEVLGGDVDHLRELLTRAESEAATLEPNQARSRMALAESSWRRHEAETVVASLKDRARELEARLTACLGELAAHAQAAGHGVFSEVWAPSGELRTAVSHTRLETVATLRRAA